jgi:hypothetical protein
MRLAGVAGAIRSRSRIRSDAIRARTSRLIKLSSIRVTRGSAKVCACRRFAGMTWRQQRHNWHVSEIAKQRLLALVKSVDRHVKASWKSPMEGASPSRRPRSPSAMRSRDPRLGLVPREGAGFRSPHPFGNTTDDRDAKI